jgi:hypothetical protein
MGDDRYRYVSHHHDSRILRQANRMVWNPKPDGPISQEAATAPDHHHK